MTALLPLLFDPHLLTLGSRRKKRATESTEPTEQKLISNEKTLLLVALYLAWRKPCNMQVFHQNVLHLPMIAATCKALQKWLMHDSIWLEQLQALMYKKDMRLSETFCNLMHRTMIQHRRRNPELHQVAWKMAGMLMESDFAIITNFELYNTFSSQFG